MGNLAGYPSAVISGAPGKSGRIQGLGDVVIPFSPLDLLPVAWWDADVGVNFAGAPNFDVTSWDDQTPNGNTIAQGTPSKQPFYDNTKTLDAKNFVNFDSSRQDALFRATLSSGITPQPNTYFAVARLKFDDGGNLFLFASNVSGSRNSIGDNGSKWRMESGIGIPTVAVDLVKHVFVGVFDSATVPLDGSRFYLDGGPSTPATIDCGIQPLNGFTMCNQQVQSGGGDYNVWDMIMYDYRLSNTEINNVGSFLATKNGLTWSPV